MPGEPPLGTLGNRMDLALARFAKSTGPGTAVGGTKGVISLAATSLQRDMHVFCGPPRGAWAVDPVPREGAITLWA